MTDTNAVDRNVPTDTVADLPPTTGGTSSFPTQTGAGDDGRRTAPTGPAATEQELLLPTPSHVVAARWCWTGVWVYVLLLASYLGTLLYGQTYSVGELFGFGNEPGNRWNPVMSMLVGGAIVLSLGTIWYVFHHEIRFLRDEESDVEALNTAAGSLRQRLQRVHDNKQPRPTLLDHAATNVLRLLNGELIDAVTPGLFRLIAEKRTARLGTHARHASGLLLLLAVLGTFAGVKAALPGLISAMSASAADTDRLVQPLRAVADAFGGNAIALIGAIALGMMATGLAAARQHLLERLDLVASRQIFSALRGADPVSRAAADLGAAAKQLESSTAYLSRIEEGLNDLGATFKDALFSLEQRLSAIVNREENAPYEKTLDALAKLDMRVESLAGLVSDNARAYQGLIDRVEERARESRAAIAEMTREGERTAKALDSMVHLGDRSNTTFERIEKAAQQLADGVANTHAHLDSLQKAVSRIEPSLGGVGPQIAKAIEQSESRSVRAWGNVEAEVSRALGLMREEADRRQTDTKTRDAQQAAVIGEAVAKQLAQPPGAVARGGGDGGDREMLARIVALLERQEVQSRSIAHLARAVALTAAGVLLAIGAYVGLARLLHLS